MTQTNAPKPDPQAAQEMSKLLDRALERFAVEHGPILRKACGVPEHVEKLDMVVICAFLGHALDRLSIRTGRKHAEEVVSQVLDQIVAEREQMKRERGTVQ